MTPASDLSGSEPVPLGGIDMRARQRLGCEETDRPALTWDSHVTPSPTRREKGQGPAQDVMLFTWIRFGYPRQPLKGSFNLYVCIETSISPSHELSFAIPDVDK